MEVGTVRVHDAGDLPPTVPFWLGEAPARTAELSEAVSDLRAALEPLLRGAGRRRGAPAGASSAPACRPRWRNRSWPTAPPAWPRWATCPPASASWSSAASTTAKGSQLIIHAPFGGRINRALGLALRKRFCVSFDFELQAAADDDTVVLSLGPQHSFPLTRVQSMLTQRQGTPRC